MTPRVSVIIPTYNYARFVGTAVESALSQSLRPVEVIVVDDGSTDETARVLDSFSGSITVLRTPNQGVSRARNTGASVATGDLLAFLDADDVWLPRKLERQAQRLAEKPAGLVHCGVLDVDAEGGAIEEKLDGMEGAVAEEMLLFRRAVVLGGGSAAVVPRAVFNEVSGFDPDLSQSADWDLYYRIAVRHPVAFVPEVLVHYRRHGGNMHRNVDRMGKDMLHAYAKAFSNPSRRTLALRRRAYGSLHAMLAGSFFGVGSLGPFIRHALLSLWFRPANITRFAGFPLRRLLRS